MDQNQIRPIFDAAIIVLGLVLAVALGRIKIARAWKAGDRNRWAAYIMLVTMVVWLLSWFVWDIHETRSAPYWLGAASTFTPPAESLLGMALGVLIAIVFSLMFLLIGRIPIVILIFSLVVLGAAVGDNIVITGLRRDAATIGQALSQPVAEYYFNRPHLMLHILQLFFCVVAAVSYIIATRGYRHRRVWFAYGTLSFSILLNETVVWVWRYIRLSI